MLRNALLCLTRRNYQVVSARYKHAKFPKVDKKMQAAAESLAARGFLRPNKPWDPPIEIEETIAKICSTHGLQGNAEFESLDIKFKVLKACFDETGHSVPNSLLHTIECIDDLKEFYNTPVETNTPFESLKKMDLPKNLHIQQDYVRFHPGVYNEEMDGDVSVKKRSKRTADCSSAAPPPTPRATVKKLTARDVFGSDSEDEVDERSRNSSDKDTLFNGQSAFPKSSTIVTGLKSRKKYEGYTAKRSWP